MGGWLAESGWVGGWVTRRSQQWLRGQRTRSTARLRTLLRLRLLSLLFEHYTEQIQCTIATTAHGDYGATTLRKRGGAAEDGRFCSARAPPLDARA